MNKIIIVAVMSVFSMNCFAVSIPNNLNCIERNVIRKPSVNPAAVVLTFKETSTSCPSCGTNNFYTMTYSDGKSYIVSGDYYSPYTAFLSDINSVTGKEYFSVQCGSYLNDGATIHLLLSGAYEGPISCFSCN